MENDKYRDQLLNDKLKKLYDALLRHQSDKLFGRELSNYKVQLRVKLNAAYRFGVHSAGGKNVC